MAHYDLYATLNLDRRDSCEQLGQEITRRLWAGETANPGGSDELRSALAVLGSPGRRAKYDAVLDNPTATPLTHADVADLAAMPDQPGPQSRQSKSPAGQSGPQHHHPAPQHGWPDQADAPASGEATEPAAQGPANTRLIFAVVVAVIVVTFAAIAGFFLLRGGFTEEGAGTAATSESPSADGSDPRALLEEYMSLDNRDERADWIRRHTDFDLLPNAALQDDSGLSVSPETWASMQADFYSADLADGELTVIDENYLSEEDITPEEFDAQRKELGPGITDAYEAIFDLEAGYGGANGILFVKTGDSWHYFVYSFKRRPSLDGLLNLDSHEAS